MARRGVTFAVIAPAGFRMLAALDAATKVMGRDLEITSATDSHTSGRHITGEAFDLSVAGMTVQEIDRLKRFLERTLGERFSVLYEVPRVPTDPAELAIATINPDATGRHIHTQPKKGTVWPPTDRVAYA